jgi:hypothetical protein
MATHIGSAVWLQIFQPTAASAGWVADRQYDASKQARTNLWFVMILSISTWLRGDADKSELTDDLRHSARPILAYARRGC